MLDKAFEAGVRLDLLSPEGPGMGLNEVFPWFMSQNWL